MARGKSAGRYTPSRRQQGGDDGGQRWLGTYADAITLLMAFFVMLYAMSDVDVNKFQAFIAGLQAPFGNEAVNPSLLPANDGILDGAVEPPDPEDLIVPSPEPSIDTAELERIERERAELERIEGEIADALHAEGLDDVATYRYDHRGLVVSLGADGVLFETGSTDISPLGRRIVTTVGELLVDGGHDVVVEGHTDNQPLRRAGYTNWNLSTDRAVAVLTLLAEDVDLDPARLGAAGYGEFRPVASNATADGRARNRRVDVVVALDDPDGTTEDEPEGGR